MRRSIPGSPVQAPIMAFQPRCRLATFLRPPPPTPPAAPLPLPAPPACARRRSALQQELKGEGLPPEEQAKILTELEKRESDYMRLQVCRWGLRTGDATRA